MRVMTIANVIRYQGSMKEVVDEAQIMGKTVVRNQKEFARVAHKLTAPKGEMYSVMSLNEAADGSGFYPMAVKVPVGLETLALEKYVHEENVHINSVYMNHIERFTRAYLNVSVENSDMLNLLLQDGHIIVVTKEGDNGTTIAEEFYVLGVTPGTLIDLTNGAEMCEEHVAEFVDKIYVYGLNGISSPGQLKGKEITLYCENLEGFDPTEHLTNMTHGMYGMLLEHYKGKVLDNLKELAQISTRMSQFKAPMVKLPSIGGMAITMKKLKDEFKNEWMDGLQVFSAEGFARSLSDEHFLVLPSAVDGYAAQARPNIVNKGLGHVTPRMCLIEKMKHVGGDIIFVAQDEWSEDDSSNYMKAVLEKDGDWYGKTVVILPTFFKDNEVEMTEDEKLACVDAWVDLNVHKSVCDFVNRPLSGFNIMSLSHGKKTVEDEANSSNQLWGSALFSDQRKSMEYMKNAAAEEAARIMNNALTGEARQLGAREILGDLSMASQKVNPDFARTQWAPYFQDNLNKALEGFGNRLHKLQIKTDGIYLKIVPDLSHFFGCNLLNYYPEDGVCEAFAPQMNREGYEKGIGIKYPKMAFDEFGKFKFVTLEELIDRAYGYLINGLITELQYEVICHELRHLHDGIIMVPAIEELKNMLAGMDFDGDALVVYCEKEFVEIIWEVKPVATTILTDEEFNELREKLRKVFAA